jgi:hypothetical protein
MIQSIIALIALGLLIRMSVRANAQFRDEVRLPMQWALNGSVNWTAPRGLALALTPILAGCILTAIVIMTLTLQPRPGPRGHGNSGRLFRIHCFRRRARISSLDD